VEPLKFTDLINGPQITSLWPDREGGIWFGTEADGLHYLRDKLIRVFTSRDGLYSEDIRTICAAPDGSFWAATADGPSQ
jgi:ligand-binding sensor domain-containing protein